MPAELVQQSGVWPQNEAASALELAEPLDLRPLDWQASQQGAEVSHNCTLKDGVNKSLTSSAPALNKTTLLTANRPAAARKGAVTGLRPGFFGSKPRHEPPGKAAGNSASSAIRSAESAAENHLQRSAQHQVGSAPAAAAARLAGSAQVFHSQLEGTPAASATAPKLSKESSADDTDGNDQEACIRPVSAQHDLQPGTEAEKRAAFAMVQPLCAAIMRCKDDAAQLSQHLHGLQQAVGQSPAAGLQACLDYILLPLVHLMDSIAATRTATGHKAQTVIAFPAAKAQKAAEAAVACSALLLQRCPAMDAATVAELLPRFAAVAELDRSQATEEVRLGALQCLSALLMASAFTSSTALPMNGWRDAEAPDPMLSEQNAPFLAYLASLCLKASEDECSAGSSGSSSIRITALQCLSNLIRRVGPGDAWAFALPGITGGLAKALLAAGPGASRQVPKGPAGSSRAAALALQALCSVLACTLGRSSFPQGVPGALSGSKSGAAATSGADAMQALRQLAAKSRQERQPGQQPAPSSDEKPLPGPPPMTQQSGTMRVERSEAWLKGAAPRLSSLLQRVLPSMCLHPRPAVRAELAAGVLQLLQECSQTLPEGRELLLEVACTLAQDEWPAVSRPCQRWLSRRADSSLTHSDAEVLTSDTALKLAQRLMGGLSKALHQGEEVGMLHARRLTTALQVAAPQQAAGALLRSPVQVGTLCSTLCTCFAFDARMAPLLLAASGGDAGPTAAADNVPGAAQHAEASEVAGELLPRLPMGLALVTCQQTYDALATVTRSLGRLAACAGGTALHSLIDHLVRSLQHFAHAMASSSSGGRAIAQPSSRSTASPRVSDSHGSSSSSKACGAATLVVVLSEVMYGASPAWQPVGSAVQPVTQEQSGELASLVQTLQELYVTDALWGVPTAPPAAHVSSEGTSSLLTTAASTPQVLGENALLMKALLEGVGVCARVMGRRYGQYGRLLRPVVLPVLERLGDGCPAVAAAAHAALSCICHHCGYAGLQGLVAANTDYIVDGLCTQLRTLESHPRAPALFAALLGRSGVPTALLPLLSEPARAAVRGLAISSRHKHPQHTAAFLRVLIQVNAGTQAEAQEAQHEMQQLAEQAQAAADRLPGIVSSNVADAERQPQQTRSATSAALAHNPVTDAATVIQEVEPAGAELQPPNSATDESAAQDMSQRMSEVKEYFQSRWEAKDEARPDDESADGGTVQWSEQQWQHADSLRSRAHAAATLAHAAGDVSGPLITHSDLQVALLAMQVAIGAVQTLVATSQVKELRDQGIEPLVSQRGGASGVQPLPPDTPQMLPMVHLVWGPLMAAVKDWRLPLVEHALQALAELSEAGGGSFLARRMRLEAWPALTQLLRYGPRPRPADSAAANAFGSARQTLTMGDESRSEAEGREAQGSAPAVINRARTAVARAVASMASSSTAGSAWTSLAFEVTEELSCHIGSTRSPGLREAACQAILALAELDCDPVWLALMRLAMQDPTFCMPETPEPVACSGAGTSSPSISFPSFRQLCPSQSQQQALSTSRPLPGVVAQAAKLMLKVQAMQPAWHAGLSLNLL